MISLHVTPVYEACEKAGALPIIPLRKTPAVKRGDHRAPECEHGTWMFAGADFKRKLTKWRCPTGECSPASRWIKADRLHPLIPRESKRFGDLYRGRGSVERAFGRLKNEAGLAPLRVRGIEKVALHADLASLPPSPPRLHEREPSRSRLSRYTVVSFFEGGDRMAEIKLSDGTLIKTTEKVEQLRPKLVGSERFVLIKDRDGKDYDVNSERIVYMRDN